VNFPTFFYPHYVTFHVFFLVFSGKLLCWICASTSEFQYKCFSKSVTLTYYTWNNCLFAVWNFLSNFHTTRSSSFHITTTNNNNDVVVVAYAFKSHNWSARQWHHRQQSVVWTSHRVVLSVGRIQQCVTSFGSHCRNTGRKLWVAISSYRHRSELVQCGSGSGETTVVKGEQNPAVGLWGCPRGGHWPPRPTSRILSTDYWCPLVLTHTTKAFWMTGVVVVGWRYCGLVVNSREHWLSPLVLSVAAVLHRAGGLMLARTGSHGSGVANDNKC